MKKYLFAFFIFCSIFSKGQNPLVKMWDKRYGGPYDEIMTCLQQASDGGYIIGGRSYSGIGGDKTQVNRGVIGFSCDYWIVKIDSLGNKEWDKDFGGTNDDYLTSLEQTSDGGYILGGYSNSGIGGDKTQVSLGDFDFWIVKIDSVGNKMWDKDYGANKHEQEQTVQETKDGGFILGGQSNSGIYGDKTQAVWGLNGDVDYWIVKIDSLGNKEWDRDFGGIDWDLFYSLDQTNDNGYILGGRSTSDSSGDKTQMLRGGADYWIIKIDSLGSKQWDKDFGGSGYDQFYGLQRTVDGGFILGGLSESDISGDKTQNTWGTFDEDYWIVKTDSSGNMQWDKDFGGLNDENKFGNVFQANDAGYLIAGNSKSGISGNKTENNLGGEQTWVIKVDSTGSIEWDKTLHTIVANWTDDKGIVLQSRDGCYVMGNSTMAGTGGDKTQDNRDPNGVTYDFWIIKFCDSTILQSLFSTTSALCPGTCTNFTNLSFNSTSYFWSFPGASPDTSTYINPTNICYANPGSYDVQLIASNANGSDTLLLTNYITVYPSPPPQSITESGDTLFAIAGSASYQWYFNTNLINGATDYFYVAQASGDYNVVATDTNGCEVEAAVFNVIAGIPSTVDSGPLTIFPNPVEDKVKIQIPIPAQLPHSGGAIGIKVTRTAIEISIYNVLGEKMEIDIPLSALRLQSSEINVQSLSPGLYILELTTQEKIFRSKFVKQ